MIMTKFIIMIFSYNYKMHVVRYILYGTYIILSGYNMLITHKLHFLI